MKYRYRMRTTKEVKKDGSHVYRYEKIKGIRVIKTYSMTPKDVFELKDDAMTEKSKGKVTGFKGSDDNDKGQKGAQHLLSEPEELKKALDKIWEMAE